MEASLFFYDELVIDDFGEQASFEGSLRKRKDKIINFNEEFSFDVDIEKLAK